VYNNGSTPSSSLGNVSAKNPGEFIPSTFESYQDAVIIGQAELDAKPMTVAEAARVLQAWKKSGTQKAALVAEQDADGKMIISAEK
jgi:L-amino acid N-acyltransferase YncA